jgi:pimeloyl-ACP methyl ester carboxylesterase
MKPTFSPANLQERLSSDLQTLSNQSGRVMSSYFHHLEKISKGHSHRLLALCQSLIGVQQGLGQASAAGRTLNDASAYAVDAAQRTALTLDVLRERGNNDKAHEEAGTPPVLNYAYDLVVDGRNLPRPVNYQLLKILPAEGVEVFDWKRPYMIIDPRAGHGAGIGGFKTDSQVGVALRGGHPVYFVVFRQHPEAGQTLADVMRAEAGFLREIAQRHPQAPKPIVVGNCQGGWATLLLAAANPDITGPLVLNGAPVATWSGQIGESPMRYNGGLLGGVVPALLMSDLGHGEFDGAHLVSNFEMLNPSRNYFGKYYDLYAGVDQNRDSFLEFERWWGGYHFTNEAEIRWIIEQIFVGNRLARGQAQLEPGRHLDLKAIRSPIIVFASRGDNITPPQQALNWIVDTYSDEHEIRVRGQRIIYMVHDKVGHLGIFVSSSIARREHAEVASTLKTIETLPPGLYEMKIDDSAGEGLQEQFLVSFHDRTMADILNVAQNDREQERDFAAVARLSEMGADAYEASLRPLVQAMVTPQAAEALRESHPSRLSRKMFSDQNPAMPLLAQATDWAKSSRQPAEASNPFLGLEKVMASAFIQGLDFYRDVRDAAFETAFLSIYGAPFLHWFGASHAQERTQKDPKELRFLPEVQAMLLGVETGGFEAAVIRMLILLAGSRGSVRRDRLERSSQVLTTHEAFVALGPDRRAAMIREQTIIVEFEAERALEALPLLLAQPEQRRQALEIVHYIVGAVEDMEPHSLHMLQRMEQLLAVPEETLSSQEVIKLEPDTTPAAPAPTTARSKKSVKP